MEAHHARAAIAERQRPEKERIHDGEHGGVGADADGQGEQRDERKAGPAAQGANRVTNVVDQAIHVCRLYQTPCHDCGTPNPRRSKT
jgi:hypothetical protein